MSGLLEATTDRALIEVIADIALACGLAIAGPRMGQSSPAQWTATQRASRTWRLIGAALSGVAGLVALGVLGAGSPDAARVVALVGAALGMVCVVPAVIAASRAMTATRRAEDAARLWRPTPRPVDPALERYRSDPGGAAATGFRRSQTALPAGVQVGHADEHSEPADPGTTRFFKLVHRLDRVAAADLPSGLRVIDVAEDAWTDAIVAVIRAAYHGTMDVDAATVRGWRDRPTSDPRLWIGVVAPDGTLVGCAISEFDPTVPEGVLDWVQVLPEYQRRGIGRALVLATLERLRGRAAFAVVSGDLDNPAAPVELYRACGFTGSDVWYVRLS